MCNTDWINCPTVMTTDRINPLTGTFELQSNGPVYSNKVIGTLAVDSWAVTFGTARRGLGGLQHAQSLPHCIKCNTHPSMAVYQLHVIRCGTIITCARRRVKHIQRPISLLVDAFAVVVISVHSALQTGLVESQTPYNF